MFIIYMDLKFINIFYNQCYYVTISYLDFKNRDWDRTEPD